MHFHRMLIFWLAGLARGLGCGSEAAVADAHANQDAQLIAAQSTTSLDGGVPPEPVAPRP